MGVIAVTGASGFLGQYVVEALRVSGHSVLAIGRKVKKKKQTTAGVRWCAAGPGYRNLAVVLERQAVETLIYMATSYTAVRTSEMIRANVEAFAEAMDVARDFSIKRVIGVGTYWQYDEKGCYKPVNLYAATKQAQRDILVHFALNEGITGIWIVMYDTYGPGDRRRKLIPMLLEAEKSGQPLDIGSGDQKVDYVHAADVGRAFVKATEIDVPAGIVQEFAVRSGEVRTVRDVVDLFERVRGVKLKVRWGVRGDGPMGHRWPCEAYRVLPGWEPQIGLEEGLAEL